MIDALLAQWLYVWPVLLVLFGPFGYWLSEPLTTAFVQVVAAIVFVLVGFSCFYHQGTKTSAWFFRLCLLWLIGWGISVYASADPSVSAPVYWKLLGLVLVAGSMRYALCEEGVQSAFLHAAALAVLVHGCAGVFEYFDPQPMPLSWIDPSQRGVIPFRSSGFFADPNVYGAYLAALLPLVLAGWFSTTLTPATAVLWPAAFLAGSAGLLVSYSRGAWLGALAGLAVVVILRKPGWSLTWRRKVLLAVSLVIVAVFLAGPFKYRFFSMARPNDMTIAQRALLTQGMWDMARHAPWQGFGLHTFSQIYPQFRRVGGDYPMYAHNEFLQTFLEGGFISLLGLVGMVLTLLSLLWRLSRRDAGHVSWLASACGGTFVCVLVHNLSGFSARIFPVSLVLAIAVGGLLRAMRREDLAPPLMIPRGLGRIVGGTFLALYLLFSFKTLHVQVLLQDASAALSAKEYLVAESSLQAILKIDRQVPQAHYLLALIQEGYGKWNVAEHHLDTAMKLNPSEAIYWKERSRLETKMGGARAEEYLKRAVALDPASEHFRLEYARQLASAGRLLEARDQLDAALRTSPGWHEVYVGYQSIEHLRRQLEERLQMQKPPSGSPPVGGATPVHGVSGQVGIELGVRMASETVTNASQPGLASETSFRPGPASAGQPVEKREPN
ncbi:MAG TPA: O-antigen ligase family protein [Candidatus Ozemobacteraceae bacterium]|nr:O-antigen ligase family protein [Candidatus Ozemobacteraceae bacterium]